MTRPIDFVPRLEALRATAPIEGLAALKELSLRMREELDPEDKDEAALEQVWNVFRAVQKYLEGEQLMGAPDPIVAAIAGNRPDIVGRVGSDAAFGAALEQCAAHIAKPYYTTNPGWIHLVAAMATTEERRASVVAELGAALQKMVQDRLAGGDLVNSVAFTACAIAFIRLRAVEAVVQIEATLRFCVERKCHYEAFQAGGPLAIALTTAGGSASAVRVYLARWQSVYPGERFVMEALYALWLLEGDAAAARAFLEDTANPKGHAYAAAALADLHDVGALPVIEARLAQVQNPVTVEAFTEALARLRMQRAAPALPDRMIFLFGSTTRTEQALGADSDDVFLVRARAKLRDPTMGQVTEVDDAAEDD